MNTTTAMKREQLFGMDARRNDEGEGIDHVWGYTPRPVAEPVAEPSQRRRRES